MFCQPRSHSFDVTPSWYLAMGLDREDTNITWRDLRVAIARIQPAFSPDQRFVVVGDIWLSNIAQLSGRFDFNMKDGQDAHPTRNQDGQDAHPTRDLEILAFLWEKKGIECLKFLEGMFAFAVWDRELEVLWLGRDRVGSRTLYYTTNGSICVAPQLRSLARFRSHDLDLVALRDYLCCAFVPGEQTLWKDLRELRPGMVLSMEDKRGFEPQRRRDRREVYGEFREEIRDREKCLEWHGGRVRSLLEQVVGECLPSGEAVGAFLSGGIDSSCIVALAAKLHDYPVHTYSIHCGLEYPHELDFANLVAKHCGTQHHVLELNSDIIWDGLPLAMAYLDDPIGEGLTVPNMLMARAAKASVNVVLNGEGGDPCFGGPKNKPMLLNSLYGEAIQGEKLDSLAAYLTSFKKLYLDLPQLLKPDVWQAVKAEPSVFSPLLNSDANWLNRLMLLNIQFKGADYILTKVNNLTQASGVVGRSPLFDGRIVELSLQIPPEYKLFGAAEKAVLKQAVADLLPEAIIKRPKSGMVMPMQQWFRKDWNRKARGLLLGKNAAIAPYLNQSIIRDWLNYRGDAWGRYGYKLWLLVSLEIWLQVNSNR